jgi:mannosyltransferase
MSLDDAPARARRLAPLSSRAVRTAVSNLFRVEVLVPGLLALVLGLITLERKAWWFDEAHDITLARLHWLRLIGEAGYYEPSQALYLVLFKFWSTFTPDSEWFTRLPSVAAAVAAAGLAGLLGARLFNRTTGVLAGTLLATNATVVSWSQQTRTYALATMMAVVVTFLFVRAMESEDRRAWLVYGIAGAVGIYAHFFVGFVLASHAVLWTSMSVAQRRRALEAWAIVALALLPAVPFVALGGHGDTDWIPPTSWHGLRLAVSTIAGFNALTLVAAGAGAVVIFSGRVPGAVRWKGDLLLAWAVVPLAGALIVSILKPMLVGRYLIVSAPALALLGAVALSAIRPRWVAAGGTILLLLVSTREIVAWYASVPEDWRGAAQFAAAEAHKGTTVALYPAGGYEAYQLYAPLPAACRHLPGHAFPRCNFRAAGRKTLVITTESEWRQLPGSANYVVVDQRRFGERIRAFRLVRRHR